MTADRDTTIAALLDRLEPPPAPSPDFWDDVRDQLEHGERRVIDLRALPPGPPWQDRRVSRRRLVTALAAAVVLLAGVLAITKAVRDDDSQRVVPANPTTTSTTLAPADELASSTVTTWIRYLVHGDREAAWEMVGSQSRGSVDRTAFDGMLTSLKDEWAPWNDPGVERHVLPLTHDTDQLSVVAMSAAQHQQVKVLVVRRTGTSVFVEPFLPGNALSLISLPQSTSSGDALSQGRPYTPPSLAQGTTAQIHVEAGATDHLVAFDGVTVPESSLTSDATGALDGVRVPRLDPGLHDLLVVEVTHDGSVAIADEVFTVAG